MKIELLEAVWRPDCAKNIDGDGLLLMKWLIWGFTGSSQTTGAHQDPDFWLQRIRERKVRNATAAERGLAVGSVPEDIVIVEMGFIVGYRRQHPIGTVCGNVGVDGVLCQGSRELEDAYWMYLCPQFNYESYLEDDM